MPVSLESSVRIGERVGELAREHPDRPAVVVAATSGAEETFSWRHLEQASNAAAWCLVERGVTDTSVVGVALPNGIEHVVATLAAWKLGALVVPLDPEASAPERAALRTAADMAVIVGRAGGTDLPPESWQSIPASPPPPVRGTPRSAHATGGSTGQPRIILREKTWSYRRDQIPSAGDRALGLDIGQVQLVMLPLHSAGFTALYHGLVLDHLVVLMERFVPPLFPRLVQQYRVNFCRIVPAMMRRISDLADLDRFDLSSITVVHQGSAACPPALKRAWLHLLGPEKVLEGYSSNERIGAVWIRGDEWLEHPGSVGRPTDCEVRILDAEGADLAPGEIGEIFLRAPFSRQPTYLGPGAPLPERDGFFSLGDMGYLDREGYLYLVDRRVDMINVGGTNVYPAEVEQVLLRLPDVRDAAVVGRAHDLLGQSVHALVVPADPEAPPSVTRLYAHCRQYLTLAKVPATYELVASLPRTPAGKLRRSALARSPETGHPALGRGGPPVD